MPSAENCRLVSARQKRGDELLSFRDRRQRHRRGIRGHGHAIHPQPPGRLGDGDVRAAEWPAASQRQVEAQPELVRLLRGEAQVVEELVGQIRKVAETALGIVESQRISRLHLESADAAFFHGAHLALQFRLGHRGTEPPPAHHHAGIVGRPLEGAPQIRHGRRRDRGAHMGSGPPPAGTPPRRRGHRTTTPVHVRDAYLSCYPIRHCLQPFRAAKRRRFDWALRARRS